METSGRRVIAAGGAVVILCLLLMVAVVAVKASQSMAPGGAVPSSPCSCADQVPRMTPEPTQFRGHGPPASSLAYDEQIGLTFTQNFTSMEYNVTAVEQTDPTLGDGPAYLLSGVSNAGYWYQVGASWDWAPGQTPGTGFAMSYEVFDTSGKSVFPANGQGGLQPFSGPVNSGDLILLSLYFSRSSQSVMMQAKDANTGATASEAYASVGASFFEGFPDSLADPNGFFTGLMTEWYHGSPYYNNEAGVVFSQDSHPLSSGWMWMDEFNAQTFLAIFSANTSAPVSYSNPTRLQEFSFNGTTEYSDAYEFVTGSLANSTQSASAQVPLTFSFTIKGGGAGYSSPILKYVSNGTRDTVALSGSPAVYDVDFGSTWSVSTQLNGSTPSERWVTDQRNSSLASSPLTVQFVYYGQYYVVFGFSVSGGGSGFSPPMITYTSFGSSANTPTGAGVWADAGSRYEYSSVLNGSMPTERWYSKSDGSVGASEEISATYYKQYLVTFDISFRNTELAPGLPLNSTSAGNPYFATMVLGINKEWLDSGSIYTIPQWFTLARGDRVFTNGTWTGEVSANLAVSLAYERQFYVTIVPNAPSGGTLSTSSGWYDSGSVLKMDAAALAGWHFEGWEGSGVDSVSSSNASLALTVGPSAPVTETAIFYPGIEVQAAGPMSVSYSYGTISGSVAAGKEAEVFVPPASTLHIAASGAAFLTTFNGWTGASNSTKTSASFVVAGPAVITSDSEYNYIVIAILALAIVLAAIAGTYLVVRRRTKKPSSATSSTGSNDTRSSYFDLKAGG